MIFVSSRDTKIAPMTICDGGTVVDDFEVCMNACGERTATKPRPQPV